MSWHQIQKIFPGLLNICTKFEEIPSTSKDAIGRQTCGAGGPFHENSSHMQTSVPRGTLNNQLQQSISLWLPRCARTIYYRSNQRQGLKLAPIRQSASNRNAFRLKRFRPCQSVLEAVRWLSMHISHS